ncbi:MAG: flagellar biosynthesis protein FliQ [Clostridiales bacterium]|nr:flagellar biosynthesis protein FliQ [Clostridiales bacterium]
MTEEKIMEIFQQALMLAFNLAIPILLIATVVGLIIAIIQAATQVHEQTLSFAPKAIAIALGLFFLGPWMLEETADFMKYIFSVIAETGL